MTRAVATLAFATAFAMVAGGCEGPNTLSGSVGSANDLGFDRVELRYLEDQAVYQLGYFKALDAEDAGAGEDTVAKVTFNEPAGGVVVAEPIDLLAAEIDGRVERVTAAGDSFPSELDSGTVTFATATVVGDTTSGSFAATFANGKTLTGDFEVIVEAASFD